MSRPWLLHVSERWFRLLRRLYPPDFRDTMGEGVVEAYVDRAHAAIESGSSIRVVALWLRALVDSVFNGIAERLRPAVSWRRAGNWGRDIELVRRRLVRSPVFAATTIGTLTIGLGLFAVVYTAVQKVLIDPMPYKDPGDLYYVWRDYGPIADVSRGALAGSDITELRKATAVIEGAAALQPFLGGIFSLREDAEAMEIAVSEISPELFEVLGVAPALGRAFKPEEAGLGQTQAIVLAHHLWNRLGADPGIVGTDVRLQGRPHTVVGVMPRDFTFVRSQPAGPPQRVDAYVPLQASLADVASQDNARYTTVIRAHRGTPPDVVAAAVEAVGRAIDAQRFDNAGLKLYPVGLKADVLSRIQPALVVLAAAGLVLVFMLMVNLASVLLARAAERGHEVAVSRALGASGSAVVRATLLEGGVLGIIGGTLGAAVAVWGTRALVALVPLDLPRRDAIVLDWSNGAGVVAVGGLLGVLAAIPPAAWVARTSLSSLLAGSAVRGGGGQGRWRRGMVVVQVALSLVLLCSGALVVRSFDHLLQADPGFRSEGVYTVRVRTPPEFFRPIGDAIVFQDRILQTLAAIPGVTGVSATSALPLTGAAFQAQVSIPGAPGNSGNAERDRPVIDMIAVRAHYVEVMGMRLLAGRTFSEAREPGMTDVMIDAALAERFFPGGDPVGAELRLGDGTMTIIGVFEQARLYDVHADGRPQILVRSEALGVRPLSYVMRTARHPDDLLPDVRAAMHRLDPRVPVGDARSMDDIVEQARSPQSIGAALISVFAIGALLLAAMGLFAVISGSVTRRRHELAVRLALGADRGHTLGLVMKEGVLLVAVGLLVGAPGIYVANQVVGGLLVGVSSSDPLTLAAASLALLLVTLVTCYIPARRVLAIDPARLLRNE